MGKILCFLFAKIRDIYINEELKKITNSLGKCGKRAEICYPLDIRGSEFVYIGDSVFIGPRCLMGASKDKEIYIEDSVMLGPEVKLIAGDHRYDLSGVDIINAGAGKGGPIIIKKGAWVGAASIILKDITIGEGAIIGAGSVVTRDVPPYEIWAGNPASVIKKRFQVKA